MLISAGGCKWSGRRWLLVAVIVDAVEVVDDAEEGGGERDGPTPPLALAPSRIVEGELMQEPYIQSKRRQ